MEVSYRNEIQDLTLIHRILPWFDRSIAKGLDFWLVVALALLPVALWLVVTAKWVALAVTTTFMVALVLFLVILVHRSNRRNFDKLELQTLTLRPEWLEVQTATSWGLRRWNVVSQITVVQGGIVITLDKWLWHAIPQRAFADSSQAEQFAATAIRYWEEARHRPPPTTELVPPEGFQLPLPVAHVSYHATQDELAKAVRSTGQSQSKKSARPNQATRQSWGWVFALAFLVVVFTLMELRNPTMVELSGLLGIASSVALFLVGVVLISRIRTGLFVRRANLQPEELTMTILGCLIRGNCRLSFIHWKDVRSILHDDDVIVFRLSANQVHIIPTRAFPTPTDAEHFAEQCHEFWTVATSDSEKPLAVSALIVDSGNPYQSPRETM